MVYILGLLLVFGLSTVQALVPPYLQEADEWAQKTLASLTIEQKIGQLFIVAAVSDPAEVEKIDSAYTMHERYVLSLIENYHIGGVLFLYKSDPMRQMILTKKFQSHASIPLLIAQDCEWGLSMRLDPAQVVRYPRNMMLGALSDEKLIYDLGYEIGQQCKALGIHCNLAPVCDVNNNPNNPVIADRSFGDDPERVAHLALHYARGLQDAGIVACAKHFPGHGDTNIDSHIELPTINHSKERLHNIELIPFKQLINEGIGAVMTAHLFIPAYDDRPHRASSLSYEVVSQELKHRLGFQGLAITDGLGMQAITNHFNPGELELEAYLAGNDIILCPLDVPGAIEKIKKNITTHEGYQDLDNRVLKILRAKAWALKNAYKGTSEDALAFIVRPEAYALQKRAYEQAITLVSHKLGEHFGPELLQKSAVITVGLKPGNNFSAMVHEHAQQLLSYPANFLESDLQTCTAAVADSEIVILALGNITKYANKQFNIAPHTYALVHKLHELGKKIIVVIFGTPYCIPSFAPADAFIVAYEDFECAHQAAADVIMRHIQAQGKLPINLTLPT